MAQSTLDDEELFTEAASEMREDVESSLADAREALPDAEELWETDADNTLGVLNGLSTVLEPAEAEKHLREAKKWYAMGKEADAFDDAEDLAAEIESVEETFTDIETASEQVSELTKTIPQLKSALEDAEADVEADSDSSAAEA
ncbi:MAG: DUF5790 family protein [Halovenus sp.]|uniref:DUF5790 family protein n=1 Tax=Halovenus amylolytica TaxID=2500550 RepID=UPI000FE2C6F5